MFKRAEGTFWWLARSESCALTETLMSRQMMHTMKARKKDDAFNLLTAFFYKSPAISSECKCAERARVVIEVIHAGNDVNPPGLATTETLTQHVNLNYFSEAVSSEVKARLADADSTSTPSSGCSPRVERLVDR